MSRMAEYYRRIVETLATRTGRDIEDIEPDVLAGTIDVPDDVKAAAAFHLSAEEWKQRFAELAAGLFTAAGGTAESLRMFVDDDCSDLVATILRDPDELPWNIHDAALFALIGEQRIGCQRTLAILREAGEHARDTEGDEIEAARQLVAAECRPTAEPRA